MQRIIAGYPQRICAPVLFLLAFIAVSLQQAQALEVPTLQGRVNDYADMLSPAAEQGINDLLQQLEKSDSTQVAVLTIPTLAGADLEAFSLQVAESWKIGRKKLDNGAIILVVKNDRKMRIEVGYGLEGKLTDAVAGRIINDVMKPRFREGDFDRGITEAAGAVAAVVRGEFRAGDTPASGGDSLGDAPGLPVVTAITIFLVIGLLAMSAFKQLLASILGGVLLPLLFFVGLPYRWWMWLLIPGGFLLVYLFAKMMNAAAAGSSGSGGSGYSSSDSSSSSSSDSSSSSSSDSYSGGGGSYGGGGASGDW